MNQNDILTHCYIDYCHFFSIRASIFKLSRIYIMTASDYFCLCKPAYFTKKTLRLRSKFGLTRQSNPKPLPLRHRSSNEKWERTIHIFTKYEKTFFTFQMDVTYMYNNVHKAIQIISCYLINKLYNYIQIQIAFLLIYRIKA